MKKLILLSIFIFSLAAFASIDKLIGRYVEKNNNKIVAVIKKELVAQPTLFEPAQYQYVLSIDNTSNNYGEPMSYLQDVVLEVGEDGQSLEGETKIECDDPGCFYYDEVNLTAKISKKGYPYIKLNYYGWHLEDEGDDEYEIEGEKIFFRRN